jgi:hypothetical protein
MSAIQDSVLSLNFTQSLLKTVADKVLAQIAKDEKGKDDKNQGQGGRSGKRLHYGRMFTD